MIQMMQVRLRNIRDCSSMLRGLMKIIQIILFHLMDPDLKNLI